MTLAGTSPLRSSHCPPWLLPGRIRLAAFRRKTTSDPDVSDKPSLFTAVQKQLALRLVPVNAAVQVLVIDHVERPTEN
jgi:uncharacterized protein (TIGR03435 family)